jgi:hypothetical protein
MNSRHYPVINLEGPSTVHLTLEQRYAVMVNIFKHQYFAVYRLIGQRFGVEAANEIAAEVAGESIPNIARQYRKSFDLDGQGAALMSQILQAEFQSEGSDVVVHEETSQHADIEIFCLFGNALQSHRFDDSHIEEGLCNRGCAAWSDSVAKTIDPNLKTERLTWMGDGAPSCRYVVSRSTAEAKGNALKE